MDTHEHPTKAKSTFKQLMDMKERPDLEILGNTRSPQNNHQY